jgi:hypothetical protein
MTLQECPECGKQKELVPAIDEYWLHFQGHTIKQEYLCEECLDEMSEAAYERFLDKYYGG